MLICHTKKRKALSTERKESKGEGKKAREVYLGKAAWKKIRTVEGRVVVNVHRGCIELEAGNAEPGTEACEDIQSQC